MEHGLRGVAGPQTVLAAVVVWRPHKHPARCSGLQLCLPQPGTGNYVFRFSY